jgi:hypothetical protein
MGAGATLKLLCNNLPFLNGRHTSSHQTRETHAAVEPSAAAMLGLLPSPHAPAPSPALTSVHSLPADPELLSKALHGRMALTVELSDAAQQLAAGSPPGPGSPQSAAAAPRRGSSESGCAAVAARRAKPALLPHAGSEPALSTVAAAAAAAAAEGANAADAPQQAQQPASPASSGDSDSTTNQGQAQAGRQTSPLSPATPVTPAGATPQPSPAPAAAAAAAPAPPPADDQLAALQAQLSAVNERAAALEYHLRAKSGEVAHLEAFRRRAQEMEALFALSSSELARAQEQHVAQQQAALSQIKAQHMRIMVLEEHLRLSAGGPDDLHTAFLQQQLAAAQHQVSAHLSRAGSAASGLAQHGASSSSAFEAASSMGLPASLGMQPVNFSLGGHALHLMERQGSLPGPAGPALSEFARDAEVWALRPPSSAASGSSSSAPRRAQSLALPGGGLLAGSGGDGGAWGVPLSAPLGLPPLPTASSASAWEAGALLIASRQPSMLDAAAHQPRESGDLISDRADAARLAGLLPFDLDTLGSERSEGAALPALHGGAAHQPLAPSLPPLARAASAGGSAGGARSAALKAAAAQKQAAAAAAHLQMLTEKASEPRLPHR